MSWWTSSGGTHPQSPGLLGRTISPSACPAWWSWNFCKDVGVCHNLGLIDSLIGQTAVGMGESLATFNTKHYALIGGLKIIRPY